MLVRTVVETGTISVATELPAGQFVMLAAQEVTVYRLVAYTVDVTSWTDAMDEFPMGKGFTPVLLEGGGGRAPVGAGGAWEAPVSGEGLS